MALHSHDVRILGVSPNGTVMTNGGSLDLALDQVGVFSTSKEKVSKKGLKALTNFNNLSKNEKLSILFGAKKDTGRMGSKKSPRTVEFTLKDIVKVGVNHPKNAEQKFDYWRVGWDGMNDNTTLKFHKGQTLEFQMTVKGVAASFFNSESCYTVRTLVNVPNVEGDGICSEIGEVCDPVDCREHTLKLVKNLNNYLLPTGQHLSDWFDIYPIFDTPSAIVNPVVYNYWTLEYCGFGGNHELSAVQAQYPGYEIKRDTMTNKFVMFAPASYTPAAFNITKGAVLKGCEDCPTGYDKVEGGFVYGVALVDDGVDQKATVQGLPGAVAGTAVRTGQDGDVGHYSVVVTKKLTEADLTAFITLNKTAIVAFIGSKADFCKDNAIKTASWVKDGDCTASSAKYRIMIPNDCKGNKLADLQEAYPELTITLVKSQNCVSVYETTVQSDFSCSEGCNPAIVQQTFETEAPKAFGINQYWYPYIAPSAEGVSAKCGFEIKAKPVILNPGECLIEDLPFIATSTRIVSLSGGYPVDYSMNSIVPKGTWAVLQLERATDLDNLGGNLRDWENKGKFYFQNEKPYRKVIERELTGTQSRLDGLTQYSDVYVTIEKTNKAGINDHEHTAISYHLFVPFGKSDNIEKVFASLAGSAGLDFEVK